MAAERGSGCLKILIEFTERVVHCEPLPQNLNERKSTLAIQENNTEQDSRGNIWGFSAWLGYGLHLILLFAFSFFMASRNSSRLNYFTSTQWLFDYEYGYVKRGLVGEITGLFRDFLTNADIVVISLYLSSAAAIFFCCLLVAHSGFFCSRNRRTAIACVIFSFWAVSSSGTIQQFFSSLGRFDVIAFSLVIFAFLLIISGLNRYVVLLLITVLSALAVMIHEGNFFWIVPITAGMWHFHFNTDNRIDRILILSLAMLILLTAFTGYSGYGKLLDFESARQLLQQKAQFPVDDFSLGVHFLSVYGNILYTMENFTTDAALLRLLLGFMLMLPGIFFGMFLLGLIKGQEGVARRSCYLISSCLAPSVLFLLGIDHGRWLSMIVISAIFAVLIMIHHARQACFAVPYWLLAIMVAGIICNIYLGPYGILRVFELSPVMNKVAAMVSGTSCDLLGWAHYSGK